MVGEAGDILAKSVPALVVNPESRAYVAAQLRANAAQSSSRSYSSGSGKSSCLILLTATVAALASTAYLLQKWLIALLRDQNKILQRLVVVLVLKGVGCTGVSNCQSLVAILGAIGVHSQR